MSALADLRAAPGLDAYLEELEERLEEAVASHRGVVAEVGAEALQAGGKRLRPLLVFLATPPGERPNVAAAATGDPRAVSVLAGAALCLARGEALQRSQTHNPETTIDAYLERCVLKTGKLFEAACLLGGGRLGSFGLHLGVAFQIVDDVLDCSGETIETGKIAGTDLREGTPTLPLLLAARQDAVVRRALAGGPLDGALVRVAATDALARSRELALEYALRARACLNGAPRREELEALTHAVVNRDS